MHTHPDLQPKTHTKLYDLLIHLVTRVHGSYEAATLCHEAHPVTTVTDLNLNLKRSVQGLCHNEGLGQVSSGSLCILKYLRTTWVDAITWAAGMPDWGSCVYILWRRRKGHWHKDKKKELWRRFYSWQERQSSQRAAQTWYSFLWSCKSSDLISKIMWPSG